MGIGSLARSLIYSLPMLHKEKLNVLIIGRNLDDVLQVTTIANSRAIICFSNIRFYAQVIDWAQMEDIESIMDISCPEVVVLAASMQSPWALSKDTSKWANLVSEVGFGFTLPFQANFAIKISRVINKLNSGIKFINACYPDEVNQILKALNLPITTGVGNISILASYLSHSFNLSQDDLFKMIGHHFHVEASDKGINSEFQKPRVWINDNEIQYNDDLLIDIRTAVTSNESNQITGISAAQVITALFADKQILTHVPGPAGLPGGYPVLIDSSGVEVVLPKGLSLEQAIEFNNHCSELDGVKFDKLKKSISFSTTPGIRKKYGLDNSTFTNFNLIDFDLALQDFIELRDHLLI